MTQRKSPLVLVALLSMGLCGCAATGDSNPSTGVEGGSIELAVSEICAAESDPQCIPVGDEHVTQPSDFEEATVEDAAVSSDGQQNSLDVTFTANGARVLNDLTTQASSAGPESRLLMKVGDEIVAAVSVMEPLSGNQVTMALSPEDDSDAVVELIHGG